MGFLNLVKLSEAVNLIIFSVSIFAVVVNFVVRAITYFEFAMLHKLKVSFLAFVPFLQFFVLGSLCDFLNLKNFSKRTHYAIYLTFFSLCFSVPSAVSYFFPSLPLFTFNVLDSSIYFLNCLLFVCNLMFWLIYLDCLAVIFKSYYLKYDLLICCSVLFVVAGVDFVVSLALLRLINKKPVVLG